MHQHKAHPLISNCKLTMVNKAKGHGNSFVPELKYFTLSTTHQLIDFTIGYCNVLVMVTVTISAMVAMAPPNEAPSPTFQLVAKSTDKIMAPERGLLMKASWSTTNHNYP